MKTLSLLRLQRFFGITMLLFFALTQTELNQVLRIPALLGHFNDHRQKDQGISFGDFLMMHYHGDDQDDSDNAKDASLPFKSHMPVSIQISDLVPPATAVEGAYSLLAVVSAGPDKISGAQSIPGNIWQPPRC